MSKRLPTLTNAHRANTDDRNVIQYNGCKDAMGHSLGTHPELLMSSCCWVRLAASSNASVISSSAAPRSFSSSSHSSKLFETSADATLTTQMAWAKVTKKTAMGAKGGGIGSYFRNSMYQLYEMIAITYV